MKVWVTRHNSGHSAAHITALGLTPVIAPIMRLSKYKIPNYNNIKTVIVTSSNGIPEERYDWNFITVGRKSAEILRSSGSNVIMVFNTVNELVLSLKSKDNSKTLYLRGKHISANLKEEIGCAEHIAYSMEERILNSREINDIKNADCVLVYSKRSAELLSNLVRNHDIPCNNMYAICISHNAALGLKNTPFKEIKIASEATENKIMEQLHHCYIGNH